jgi:gamma-glutamylcyclotransferase (GGCT)/AIG2-like uncharacterized protein YtfP
MSKKLYLAYGSNLNLEQMAHRCPTAKVVGKAEINNMQLLFRGPYESAVATIEPRKGSAVPVLIWEITPEDEEALDRYEGFPLLYRKETVNVKQGGKAIKAMVYIMNEGRPLGKPGCYYYSIIYEGYISAGFDTEILKKAVADSMED